MIEKTELYINGAWVASSGSELAQVINPATEQPVAVVTMGTAEDVDKAVLAARAAFASWSTSDSCVRRDFITAIYQAMLRRQDDLVEAISTTMGCPPHIAASIQVAGPTEAMGQYAQRAQLMDQEQQAGHSRIVREAVGVCGLISPWNYPLHQFVAKVAPALAAGCTMVVKPSEQTPLQDFIMAEIFDEVGLPAGVFNMVPGFGASVGNAISQHPDIDLVSFTGSVAGGVAVATSAAPTVKRVTQELGGKSPYIITDSADLKAAVNYGVDNVMLNSGQTCSALTRMLVPKALQEQVVALAKHRAESLVLGMDDEAFLGPLSSSIHRERVRSYINRGVEEGARLVTGGIRQPESQPTGFYVTPTLFADVDNSMTIAREEIFGPVLCIMPYDSLDDAIAIANDSDYGLSSAVWAEDTESALVLAKQLRAGLSYVQGAGFNYEAPFGGYKRSGNGREYGDAGLHEYIELKSIQIA